MSKRAADFVWFGWIKRWLINRKLRKAYNNCSIEDLEKFFTRGPSNG